MSPPHVSEEAASLQECVVSGATEAVQMSLQMSCHVAAPSNIVFAPLV